MLGKFSEREQGPFGFGMHNTLKMGEELNIVKNLVFYSDEQYQFD